MRAIFGVRMTSESPFTLRSLRKKKARPALRADPRIVPTTPDKDRGIR